LSESPSINSAYTKLKQLTTRHTIIKLRLQKRKPKQQQQQQQQQTTN